MTAVTRNPLKGSVNPSTNRMAYAYMIGLSGSLPKVVAMTGNM